MKEPLLTIDEVAWYLRLSHMTIYRMIQRKDLQAVKIANQWRFRREAVEKWLGDHVPAEEVSPPNSMRSELTDFEKRYWPAIHEFFREIIETKPDILALVDRRGARLFSAVEPPSEYKGLTIGYNALVYTPDADIKGKYIALLDDCIQDGSTFAQMKQDLEARGAQVRTFAFLGCESFLSGKNDLMEPQVRVCLRLPDTEFTRVLAEVTEYLLKQGKTQDTDHFALRLAIRGKRITPTVQQFLGLLANLGDVFTVPSPAEENGIITITLDRPSFFRFKLKGFPVKLDLADGVVKIRFYYDVKTNTCLCLPIVMPKVKLDTNTYFETVRDDINLPINLREMGCDYDMLSDKGKATFCYRDITTNISLALAEQIIRHLNGKGSPFIISLCDPPINREDLELCYGKVLGGKLADQIVHHLSKDAKVQIRTPYQVTLFRGQTEPGFPLVSAQRAGEKQLHSLFRIMPAIDHLTKWYDEKKACFPDRAQRPTDNGLTFIEMCQRLEDWMDPGEVSFALDLGLDRTVIAPVHIIKSFGAGNWEIRKGYRPGESSPGEPPKVGHGDSKALDHTLWNFRRDKFLLPYLVDRLMDYCPSQRNGVEPLLLFKVLACLIHDCLTKQRSIYTLWKPTPKEFGPLPEILHTDLFIEDGGNPYQLAQSKQAYISYEPKLNSQTGRHSKRSYFMPVEGWREVVQQYFNGDDLSAIDAYLQLYSALYNGLDAISSKRPSADVLLTLSACFSEASTYKYAHANLLLWVDRFGRFIELCNQKLIHGKVDGVAKTITACERTAAVAIDKITRNENLQTTEKTIRQVIESQSNVLLLKRGSEILDRINKSSSLSARLLTMEKMAELMKAFSTLVKYSFSRSDDFNIPDTRPEGEQEHKLNYYVEQARQMSKGLIKAELFRAFEIPEKSINTDILRHLMHATDELYQGIRLSFGYNCPVPDLDARQDAEEVINVINRQKKWLTQNATNTGVFMFTDLDGSTRRFSTCAPIEIGEVIQQYKDTMKYIIAQFEGELIKLEGDGNFIIFKNETDALISAITILQNISKVSNDLTLLPMCIGITKGEYLQTGKAARNQLGPMINWASKLAGIDPPGLYITEDILDAVNKLRISSNEFAVPDSFAAFEQKIFSVSWNLVKLAEII